MITPEFVRTMAAYNAEMNRRLYDAAGRLTEAQRQEARGAFWGSLQGSLSHLLWGDQIWMARFAGWPAPAMGQQESAGMVAEFAVLQAARVAADAGICAWACDSMASTSGAKPARCTAPSVAVPVMRITADINLLGLLT